MFCGGFLRWGLIVGMGRSAVAVDVGKVETPSSLALCMVEKLFGGGSPPVGSRVLDAGCGWGVFVEALLSYLGGRGGVLPEVVCGEGWGACGGGA